MEPMGIEFPHQVKVVEECQISPPPLSVPPTILPITVFDLGWLILPPVCRLCFYQLHHPNNFITTILPNIKNSLSITLKHFYPLAGNLSWPSDATKPEFHYKDGDSVSLTVAECHYADFHKLSGNHPREVNLLNPLIPKFKPRGNSILPLLALQVTVFPNNGICIGMAVNHVVADGRSSIHFLKTWASICGSNGDVSFVSPDYDRSITKDQKPSVLLSSLADLAKIGITRDTFYVLKDQQAISVDKVRATFQMTNHNIRRLKQWIPTVLLKTASPLHLSSLVVTCAYVWVCWIKTRCAQNPLDSEETEYLIIPADLRARINPPLPVEYFGNCLSTVDVMSKTSDLLGEDGVAIAAELIGRGIQNIDVYPLVKKDVSHFMSLPQGHVLSITSSPKFAVYDADFGWGKPNKVDIGGDSISLSECPNESGGIEIGWLLDKTVIDVFSTVFANSLPALL